MLAVFVWVAVFVAVAIFVAVIVVVVLRQAHETHSVLDRRNIFRRLLEAVVVRQHEAFLAAGALAHDATTTWHPEFTLDSVGNDPAALTTSDLNQMTQMNRMKRQQTANGT